MKSTRNSAKPNDGSPAGSLPPSEFLNRIDEIIIFDRLTAEELKIIVDIQLSVSASAWKPRACSA